MNNSYNSKCASTQYTYFDASASRLYDSMCSSKQFIQETMCASTLYTYFDASASTLYDSMCANTDIVYCLYRQSSWTT